MLVGEPGVGKTCVLRAPELRDRLALRRNRALHSRLHHRLDDRLAAAALRGHA